MVMKYSGPDDVYRDLVENTEDHWILGLLAFAVVEQQRIDWAKHRIETNGVAPTPDEVKSWYEDQPKSAIVRARAEAETALNQFGAEAVEEFDDSYRKEISQGIVVAEIQRLGKWWPQLGTNIVGGVMGSVVFTAILIVFWFFVLGGPSTDQMALRLKLLQAEIQSGQVGNNK